MAEAPRIAQESDSLAAAQAIATRLIGNIEQVVLGKHDEIALVLSALASGGHVLLEDVPGTAKTILARSIAQTIDGTEFARIQCTPDLQPTDVTGLAIYNQKTREFEFRAGSDLREHRARRRDQPRDAAHAVGAARGDGRAPGDGRRRHAPAADAVPRHRDREPDRAGGNVPAARGAARPLRAALRARLSLGATRRSRSSSRSATVIRSRACSRGSTRSDVETLRRSGRGRLRRRAGAALDRRPRARDAARRRRLDRRFRPRQPHARADGARVGADAGTRPRRPRRRRARSSCPCSATACSSRRRSSPRLARSAAPRRCGRSRSAASSSRRRPRPTGTARRPVSSSAVPATRTPHLPARAAAAARRASLRRPAEPAARPRQRRDRNASVRDRRSGRARSTGSRARGSRQRPAGTSSSSATTRPTRRRASSSSATAGRRWAIYAPPLPWLSKPRVVAEATAALVTSAMAARADVASLDYGDGEPYWLPPGRKDVPGSCRSASRRAAFDAGEDNLAEALSFLGQLHSDLPNGHVRLRAFGLPRAAAA